MRQVGEAALREGAHEIERRDGLVVALDHPLGIGSPGLHRRLVRVDDVPAEGRQLDPVHHLGGLAPRLRELACDPPDLDHGQRRAVREHRGHLEQDLQLLANRRGGDVPEGFRAIPGLEHERSSLAHLAEPGEERAGLPGEHERGKRMQALAHRVESLGIGPAGLLAGRQRAPRGRNPGLLADRHDR